MAAVGRPGGARVTVVGAGVIGLSCAARLLEAGHRVTVVTDLPPERTTSAVAAALWHPYLAFPAQRVARWSATTYDVLCGLADRAGTGVRLMPGRELLGTATPDPSWLAAVPDLRRLRAHERGGHPDGWAFTAPLVDMPVYLEWLTTRVLAGGGALELRRVQDLDAEAGACDAVVNCTGFGARELADDSSVHPIRGQVVLLDNPGVTEWVLDETDASALTYVIPRLRTVVCGGTAEVGREELEPDPAIGAAILARARALVPDLADAAVVGHRTGLRPGRPEVRLELEPRPGGVVVHCYGHGGAGVTLSWGCAAEVTAEVAALVA